MTAYSAITSGQIDSDSPLDTTLAAQWSNNLLAIQENDATAPTIAYATAAGSAVSVSGSNVVGVSQLKLTNQDYSVVGNGNTALTSPSTTYRGLYGWTVNTGSLLIPSFYENSTPYYSATVSTRLQITGGNGVTNYARCYYISSSPPYNLGDGQIPLFIYAVIDKTAGKILQAQATIDPHWAYNGPTNIVPDRYGKDGKIFQFKREVEIEIPDYRAQLINAKTPLSIREKILDRLNTDKLVEVEITQAMKNADMNLFPHPFNNIPSNSEVVLIDPVSPILEKMLGEHNMARKDPAVESITRYFTDGHMKIGNTDLARKKPAGLMCVSVDWKNTG